MTNTDKEKVFSTRLLTWYETAKRDLPWRSTRDPYAVWVSEMMLQQTQVATVIPYWTRWMEQFPTVVALADASLDDVLQLWQGLGYYARARNLHKAAQVIVAQHNGVFPSNYEAVLALPGIGRYTAGAICSIALEQDTPIVDANVIRVLCRVFGLPGDPKSPEGQERLWELATRLIPTGRARDFNQAMMELGALTCDSSPKCATCPLSELCTAYATGLPTTFPQFAPKKAFTAQTDVSAILGHPSGDGRCLAIQREPNGLWGGLYEFPRVTALPVELPSDAAIRALREIVGLSAMAEGEPIATVRHGVTTRKITLLAVPCRLTTNDEPRPLRCQSALWATLEQIEALALSSPQRRLLEQLKARQTQPSLF